MGDRALIQFKAAGEKVSPVTYLHWAGSEVGELLRETREFMRGRDNDVQYAAARFVGICSNRTPGNLSLGIWNKVEELVADDSHGDAGCFVVNITNDVWRVECSGGYGFDGKEPDLS